MKVLWVSVGVFVLASTAVPTAQSVALGGGGSGARQPVPPGSTTRVSVSSSGAQGVRFSSDPAISADGRYVAFRSFARLVLLDTNNAVDIYVRDRVTGSTERVSVDSAGVQSNRDCWQPAISADGRYVVFHTSASNLAPLDTNGYDDVFVRDRWNGMTERVSLASDGAEGDSVSGYAAISADGRYVAFSSSATNLVHGDTNGLSDVFVRDLSSGTTERVSVDSAGVQGTSDSSHASLSKDGRYVAFDSYATNLVSGDTNGSYDVFVRDRWNGTTERVSVASGGAEGDRDSFQPSISAEGTHIAFWSAAHNLVPGDTNAATDVFVHDRRTGTTERVSISSMGEQSSGGAWAASISGDGRYVAFHGHDGIAPRDTNGSLDVLVRDRRRGTTELASVTSGGTQGHDDSYWPAISADGRHVAFYSYATDLVLGDTNGLTDVFVRERF